jgi:myo-inositol-1(or 4)-monophosphatase
MHHSALLNVMIAAARKTARALKRDFGELEKLQVSLKGPANFVSSADRRAEETLFQELSKARPGYGFLGEEGGAREGADKSHRWIVDPLDGTTNYVHDVPMYCVSIGLMVSGELVVGIVYDPRQREMFAAAKGHGAWLGDHRISASKVDRLEDALLATGFAPDLKGRERSLDWWRYFSFRCQSLRRTGSTALNLAYLACGRFDGYWAFDNHAWDVAGGFVLVREAGGTVTRLDGGPEDCFAADQIATNGRIHAAMVEHLKTNP